MTEKPEQYGTPDLPPITPGQQSGQPYPYSFPPGPSGPAGQYSAQPSGVYPGAYPPPPMPYGTYPGAPMTAPRNGLGIAALVAGIAALVATFTIFGGIALGLLAVVLGVLGRARVKKGEANNGGVALTGIILGVAAILISAAFMFFGVWVFKTVGGKDYVDCVQQAGQDQAAVDQCTEEFRQSMENKFSQTKTPAG